MDSLPPSFVYLLADVGTSKERMLAFLRFTPSQLFAAEFSSPTWLQLTPNPVVHDFDRGGLVGFGLGLGLGGILPAQVTSKLNPGAVLVRLELIEVPGRAETGTYVGVGSARATGTRTTVHDPPVAQANNSHPPPNQERPQRRPAHLPPSPHNWAVTLRRPA